MAWLEGQLEALDMPTRAAYGLTLSVDEALVNVMTHGFDNPASGQTTLEAGQRQIQLHCTPRDGHVMVQIHDNGPPFDPTLHAPADLADDIDETRIGGHGVRLMRHFLSELSYERQGEWNVLTLVSGK
jgi:serine/threonine-protein kinase RsbW